MPATSVASHTDPDGWPLPSSPADGIAGSPELYLYQARVDAYKTVLTAAQQAVFQAYLDVAKGQVDRAQARAVFIQTAASGVATAYAAILAFTFGMTSAKAKPFPIQGVVSPVFLGFAIVLATFYLAYFRDPRANPKTEGVVVRRNASPTIQRNAFIIWTNMIVGQRLAFLHAAIVSFAWGVGTLPLAYGPFDATTAKLVVVFAVITTLCLPPLLSAVTPAAPVQTEVDSTTTPLTASLAHRTDLRMFTSMEDLQDAKHE